MYIYFRSLSVYYHSLSHFHAHHRVVFSQRSILLFYCILHTFSSFLFMDFSLVTESVQKSGPHTLFHFYVHFFLQDQQSFFSLSLKIWLSKIQELQFWWNLRFLGNIAKLLNFESTSSENTCFQNFLDSSKPPKFGWHANCSLPYHHFSVWYCCCLHCPCVIVFGTCHLKSRGWKIVRWLWGSRKVHSWICKVNSWWKIFYQGKFIMSQNRCV